MIKINFSIVFILVFTSNHSFQGEADNPEWELNEFAPAAPAVAARPSRKLRFSPAKVV
jgi:hypothetical protein